MDNDTSQPQFINIISNGRIYNVRRDEFVEALKIYCGIKYNRDTDIYEIEDTQLFSLCEDLDVI